MSAPAGFLARGRAAGLRAGFAFADAVRFAAGLRVTPDFFALVFGAFAPDFDVFFMARPAAGRGKTRENFG